MKEFIDKLISRLEEKFKYNSEQAEIWADGSDKDSYFREKKDLYLDRANIYGEIMRIVNQLAEEYKHDTTFQYVLLQTDIMKRMGIDVSCKWETATQQAHALNEAYMRGRQDERDKFAKWQDEHKENVIINEQYCWQTCGATEHCRECNRLCNGSIDYYENYDFMAEEHNNGWIACSERLPEEEGEYLTYVNYDDDCFIAIDEFLCQGLLAGWNCTPNYRVLAWQPLPPKYEPKGE